MKILDDPASKEDDLKRTKLSDLYRIHLMKDEIFSMLQSGIWSIRKIHGLLRDERELISKDFNYRQFLRVIKKMQNNDDSIVKHSLKKKEKSHDNHKVRIIDSNSDPSTYKWTNSPNAAQELLEILKNKNKDK